MKNIALLIFLISGIVLLDACTKVETDPKIDFSQTVAPQINEPADGSSYVMTEDNAAETITFSWSAASYSIDVALASTTYLLQIVVADSSFEGGLELISTTETSFTVSYGEFNNQLLAMGLTPLVKTQLKVRVSSSLKSYDDGKVIDTSIANSETIMISVTTYESAEPIEYPKLWVPGDYQGWAPDVAPNVFSIDDDGVYKGYVYYPPESPSFKFKFTTQGNWDGTNYGSGASPLTLDAAGGDIEDIPSAGNYYLTADLNDLVWSYNLENYALVGTMTEWGDQPDIELTWDADNLLWTATLDLPAETAFKWRANSAWDYNLGVNDPDNGKLVQGGGDVIVAAAGNYTVNLYLYEAFPRYELIAN